MPTVSVVIPAYNAEAYLREALDSVFAQTRPPDEVVVVDDGSTDRTSEVAASYGDRVRLLRQPNRGEAAARNAGVLAARGALIAFLDADDTWLPRYLESQLRVYVLSLVRGSPSRWMGCWSRRKPCYGWGSSRKDSGGGRMWACS
jgi:glycosyltransferase involved in cell wall biosynthesis